MNKSKKMTCKNQTRKNETSIYNTLKDKAAASEPFVKLIAYDNEFGANSMGVVIEELCRTASGEYFLIGSGGACTPYGINIAGIGFSCGSRIVPLTVDEAKEWVKAHFDADIYTILFRGRG